MDLEFSFIVPVYNRPQEVRELFESMRGLQGNIPFEVVLVEDGSEQDAARVVEEFKDTLNVKYLVKENTGPGSSRNYGMRRASGNYFIILDSDCLLPQGYLLAVIKALQEDFVHCYGGPDKAHRQFSPLQKAIDFAMTSFLTTGGIRGGKAAAHRFEPRSFNMGLSERAFNVTAGFGDIHPGEDPDLSIRLREKGFRLRLIPEAFVYHKRRISFRAFYRQLRKFGMVRPILNRWHPTSAKLTYWFPTLFFLGFLCSMVLFFVLPSPWQLMPLGIYLFYFLLLFLDALRKYSSLKVAVLALMAVAVQFTAYGLGFIESTILVTFSGKKPREIYPELFFEANLN